VAVQRFADYTSKWIVFLMADQATKWQDLGQVSAMAMLRQLQQTQRAEAFS
jgi:hypothetical protein